MRSLRDALDRVDWNFEGSSTPRFSPHLLHWFAGNFIPQIPAYLIELLSKPGDLVFDPFCGSGTTGVEATLADRPVIMSDVNRACLLISQGKLDLIREPSDIATDVAALRTGFVFDTLLRRQKSTSDEHGTHPDLDRWFHQHTLEQLRYLWHRVLDTQRDTTRNVLMAVFSDTLFACASTLGSSTRSGLRRRHHWGWIADNVLPKRPHPHNAIEIFRGRLIDVENIAKTVAKPTTTPARLIRQDARNVELTNDSVDLIVTSPPYLAMIDYTLAHRLTYLWMGWDLVGDRDMEVGARSRRNRKDAEQKYDAFIDATALEVRRILKVGGLCAIVLGNSRKYPRAAESAFSRLSAQLEIVWGPTRRTPTRRRVSERRGTEPAEFLCVLRKQSA